MFTRWRHFAGGANWWAVIGCRCHVIRSRGTTSARRRGKYLTAPGTGFVRCFSGQYQYRELEYHLETYSQITSSRCCWTEPQGIKLGNPGDLRSLTSDLRSPPLTSDIRPLTLDPHHFSAVYNETISGYLPTSSLVVVTVFLQCRL